MTTSDYEPDTSDCKRLKGTMSDYESDYNSNATIMSEKNIHFIESNSNC